MTTKCDITRNKRGAWSLKISGITKGEVQLLLDAVESYGKSNISLSYLYHHYLKHAFEDEKKSLQFP